MAAATVLVVDDDKLTRFSLSKILGRAGCRIREARSAQEGLAAIEKEQPRLVLLDIRLPDRDGFTVLREIRARFPGLPVVMMTAHHTEETAHRATAMGAWAYLTKPCDPEALRTAVSAALDPGSPPPSDTR
ncbi:MAG: response regulator [Zetaproteobacteria bacterium]|nr:MAG: response regulator [Zetaproteobacteria bacterium]